MIWFYILNTIITLKNIYYDYLYGSSLFIFPVRGQKYPLVFIAEHL